MAPTWIPLCTTMQLYCEPYFTAVERWRNYSNHQLLINRISLIEIADRIFNEYSQKKEETFEFDLITENPDIELLPETLPSVGKTYVIGGDKLAFNAAKALVPEHLFNRIGLFFQNFLLKQIAGHSDSYLETANTFTRNSIVAAVEKLFVLPEEAGKARFIYRPLQSDGTYGKFRNFATSPMGETATLFAEYLIESALAENPKKRKYDQQPTSGRVRTSEGGGSGAKVAKKARKSSSSSSNNTEKRGRKKKDKTTDEDELGEPGSDSSSNKDEDEENEIEFCHQDDYDAEPVDNWITDHTSVGTKVASYFPDPKSKRRRLFTGEVVKYAPPSNAKAKDQLYHIIWEDGDEEDYDQKQYDKAIERYRDNFQWIIDPNHPMIGIKVAAFFDISKSKKKVQRKLYIGEVKKYFPPNEEKKEDELFHIVWEDGDEEDYDANELKIGRELYEENVTNAPPSPMEGVTSAADEKKEEEEAVKEVVAVEEVVDHPKGEALVVADVSVTTVEKVEVVVEKKEEEAEEEVTKMEVEEEDDEVNEKISELVEEDAKANHNKHNNNNNENMTTSNEPVEMAVVESVVVNESIETKEAASVKVQSPAKPKASGGKKKAGESERKSSVEVVDISQSPPRSARGRSNGKAAVTAEKPSSSSSSKPSAEKKQTTVSAKKGGKKGGGKKAEEEEEEDDWTVNHPSVGTSVAAYFPVPGKKGKKEKKLFSGKITRYAPETKKGKKDQLYHVVWEDGDEEDYEEKEYQNAVELYQNNYILPNKSKGEEGNEEREEEGERAVNEDQNNHESNTKNDHNDVNNNDGEATERQESIERLVVEEAIQQEESSSSSLNQEGNIHDNNHHHPQKSEGDITVLDTLPFNASSDALDSLDNNNNI